MTRSAKFGAASRFEPGDIKRALGSQAAQLIELVARDAREAGLPLYLAGGVVRDLLLGKRNLDLDFVVEGDAIAFAQSLARRRGGRARAHTAFGTATWTLAGVAAALDEAPARLDFARARSETYALPAALPRVKGSDIKRDMLRRDFSVNALAIQLSPREEAGALLDCCGGKDDLERGLIRALHKRSFVDDPTRILRALRYAGRLGFELESDTAAWMKAALPYLGRVSGQRLSNEIDLILQERLAGEIMLRLQDLGALIQIHEAFRVSWRLPDWLARCQQLKPPWSTAPVERQNLRWMALLSGVGSMEAQSLCERLALPNKLRQSIIASERLAERLGRLDDPAIRPSQAARILDELPDAALQFAWMLSTERPAAQSAIAAYASDWRDRRPTISGDDLKAMGVVPGPLYRRLLDRLRAAWIDGEVATSRRRVGFAAQALA